MKNKKGFTLIELLAVIVILALLMAIAYPAVSKYIVESKEDLYSLHEADMKSAAANKMAECVKGNVKDCVPESGGSKTLFLSQLVAENYTPELKDPMKSNAFCSSTESYVVVTNSNNNVVDLDYQVCLKCSNYESKICETVKPEGTCDRENDKDRPVCGEAVGTSTVWSNADRIVSIGCDDTGCGCTQGTFYKRFDEDSKNGVITIVDKAGNTTDCVVPVYVDKTAPSCTLTVSGSKGENGWYGGSAPVVTLSFDSSKDVSGIATYGIGTSAKNYDLNKKKTYTVSPGITTVYGYVKDNAGNIGTCGVEVKYDDVKPTSDVTFGYQVYPKSDIATKSGQKIVLNNFIKEYGNVIGAIVYLDSNPSGMSVTLYEGSREVAKRTISSGVNSMKFTFSGSYDGLTFDMGSATNLSLVSKIELITTHMDDFYTNKDVVVYASSKDSFSGKAYFSFDGGTFSVNDKKEYSSNITSGNVITKDFAGNISEPLTYTITNIDKIKPSCYVTTNRAADGKNGWFIANIGMTLHPSDQGVSNVRDHNLTTDTTASYSSNLIGEQTTDTKVTRWHGYVRDRAGNVEKCHIDIKLDKVDPTCSIDPEKTPDGENGWYISTVGLNLNFVDVTSGVVDNSTNHFLGISNNSSREYTNVRSVSFNFDTKSKTYYCYVEDESGRTGSNSITVKRDTVNPTCTITPDRNPDGKNGWYINNVTYTLGHTSDTSPIVGYDFTNSSTSFNYANKKDTQTFSSDINTTWYGYVKEESGRTSKCNTTDNSKPIKVDKTDPTCELPITEGEKGDNDWYVTNIKFTLNALDEMSGIKYKDIRGSTTRPASESDYNGKGELTHTQDATGIIYYGYVEDSAGRIGQCSSNNANTVKKDSTKPNSCTLTITSGDTGKNNWYISDVGLSVTTALGDNLSGVVGYDITSGDPAYSNKKTTYTVTTDTGSGSTKYTAYIKDAAGNIQTCSVNVKRDTIKPSCNYDVSGTSGINGWYKGSSVTLYMKAYDSGSGVAASGSVAGSNTDAKYTNGVTSHSYSSYMSGKRHYCGVEDNAGWRDDSSRYIKFKPAGGITCSIGVDSSATYNSSTGWYTSSSVKLILTTSDTHRGTSPYRYTLTTSTIPSYPSIKTTTITRYANTGDLGITYYGYVMDIAGNTLSCSKTIKKDSSKPRCYLSFDGDLGNNGWYVSNNVNIDLTYYDYGSGIDGYGMSRGESTGDSRYSGNNHMYQNSNTKGTTFYCYVKDKAGNEYSNNKTLKLDHTNPTCTVEHKQGGDWISYSTTYKKASKVYVRLTNMDDSTSGFIEASSSPYNFGLGWVDEADFNGAKTAEFDYDSSLTYYGYLIDEAGNVGKCSSTPKRDTGNVTCGLSVSCTSGNNGWCKSAATVSFTAYDKDSNSVTFNSSNMGISYANFGSSSFSNVVDGNGKNKSSLYLSGQGRYVVQGLYNLSGWDNFWGSDDGMCGTLIKIDTESPSKPELVSGYYGIDKPASESAHIKMKSTDSMSGIWKWEYQKVGSTSWTRLWGCNGREICEVSFGTVGNHSRYFRTTDYAGNVSYMSDLVEIYVDPCTNVSNVTTTVGKCMKPNSSGEPSFEQQTCGDGVATSITSGTGASGAICSTSSTVTCSDFSVCSNAGAVCKKAVEEGKEGAMFGFEPKALTYSINSMTCDNYGEWQADAVSPTCYCENGVTLNNSVGGYDRICSGSDCGDYLGVSIYSLKQMEAADLANVPKENNPTWYCSRLGSYFCSCTMPAAYKKEGDYYYFNSFTTESLNNSNVNDACIKGGI